MHKEVTYADAERHAGVDHQAQNRKFFMLFKNRQLYIANSTLILALLGRKPYTPHMRINARCEQVVLSMEVK